MDQDFSVQSRKPPPRPKRLFFVDKEHDGARGPLVPKRVVTIVGPEDQAGHLRVTVQKLIQLLDESHETRKNNKRSIALEWSDNVHATSNIHCLFF
jgi:hypothetical protein